MDVKKKVSRVAGALYLALILFGVFAEFFVRSELVRYGDATITLSNISNSEQLFRIGFVLDLFMLLAYFFLPIALYRLFESVNKKIALVMVLSVSVAVASMLVNMLHYFMVILVSDNKDYLTVFDDDQRNALGMLFIYVYHKGYMISQIFFGLWLLPLGYLVIKSGLFPRFLGLLVIIAGLGWMMDSFIHFLSPEISKTISRSILICAALIEFSLCFWLLIIGPKTSHS